MRERGAAKRCMHICCRLVIEFVAGSDMGTCKTVLLIAPHTCPVAKAV